MLVSSLVSGDQKGMIKTQTKQEPKAQSEQGYQHQAPFISLHCFAETHPSFVSIGDYLQQSSYKYKQRVSSQSVQELYEVFVIPFPYTVPDSRAVVIKPFYTAVAN